MAEMTPLIPGAGPPPTNMPSFLIAIFSRWLVAGGRWLVAYILVTNRQPPATNHRPMQTFSLILQRSGSPRGQASRPIRDFRSPCSSDAACIRARPVGVGVANIVEEQRDHYSVVNADHRAAAAAEQEADRGVPQLATIGHVEWDRAAAAQLVATV